MGDLWQDGNGRRSRVRPEHNPAWLHGIAGYFIGHVPRYGSWAREKRKNRSKKGGSLKRNNSDTFEGLLANIDGAERDADDDQTIATNTTMSTAGTGGSSSRRSVQMQNMHNAGHRRDNDRFDDNDHHATEKKERPMRHRHHELV